MSLCGEPHEVVCASTSAISTILSILKWRTAFSDHRQPLAARPCRQELAAHGFAPPVDVVSGDAGRGATPARITHNTIIRLERLGKGIVLFHDTKRITAEALDGLLTALENDGYKVVHVVSNTAYQPDAEVLANPEIFRSMAEAARAGKGTRPDAGKFKDGPVTIVHNEWIELNPGVVAGQRPAEAIFGGEPAGATSEE
jgi:hypothetical protein